MAQFEAELRQRAELAVESLRLARRGGDDYLAAVRMGEIEELTRIADAHDVTLPALSRMAPNPA